MISKERFEFGIVFAAACCERLFPTYVAFCGLTNSGDPQRVRRALDTLWTVARGGAVNETEVASLRDQCAQILPDSEDFESPFTDLAQCACTAICDGLEYCLTKEPQILDQISEVSIEAVDVYLNFVNDPILEVHGASPEFDDWLREAPLLRDEQRYQKELVETLKAATMIDDLVLDSIRKDAARSGIQPIRRGLIPKYLPNLKAFI